MSLGELLADLPSEVRVHIFCLALGLSTSGALLRRWLCVALVSQCDACSVLCGEQHPAFFQLTWLNNAVLRKWALLS